MDEKSLTDAFLSRLRHRYSIDSERMTTTDWLEQNTTLRKRPFSIKGYEFQRAIADDMHENMSVIKPSQVGLTEIQIRKALAMVRRNDGMSIIYTMPNDEMRGRVSQTRIKPIVENDPVFMTEFDEDAVRAKGLMQFGQSFLYLTGAKEGDATSIPADVVFNDETDLTDEEMLNLFRSRLQGSKYKINQKFSTPTYPKAGINKDYTASDQNEYMIQCDACNHWQVPVFSRQFCHIPGLGDKHEDLVLEIDQENVGELDLRAAHVHCESCHTPLDLGGGKREWVPLKPSMSDLSRGYRVRPFSLDGLDIRYITRELLEAKKKSSLRRFYNTVLGEAYIDDSIALSEEMVKSQMLQPHGWQYNGQQVFVGIDVGQNCHLVMGTYNRVDGWNVFHWEIIPATQLEARVGELFAQDYKIVGGSIDRHPYTPTAIGVREISKGKIIPVEYRGTTEVNVKENELISSETYAQVNRTQLLDDVAKAIRTKTMTFTNYGDKQNLILTHMMDMVRHEEEGEKAVWKKQTGEDHFFHAIGFMVASKKLVDFLFANEKTDVRSMVMTNNIDMKRQVGDNLSSSRGVNRVWASQHSQ